MGASYLVFSAMVAGLVYGAPKIQNNQLRNTISMALAVAAPLVCNQIFNAHYSKTGLRMRTFWYA